MPTPDTQAANNNATTPLHLETIPNSFSCYYVACNNCKRIRLHLLRALLLAYDSFQNKPCLYRQLTNEQIIVARKMIIIVTITMIIITYEIIRQLIIAQ